MFDKKVRKLFPIVCQKKDGNYTDEELDNFDEESKGFYQIWVKLHAEKGVTNYIHMFTC